MALNTARRPGSFGRQSPYRTPAIAVGVIVVIAIIYFLLTGSSAQTISSNKTVTLTLNSSLNFNLPSNSNISSVFLASTSNSSALLYVSRLPVLEKEIILVPLAKGQNANLSLYNTPNANIRISLVSVSATNATILMQYLPQSLSVKPSTLHFLNSTSFGKTLLTTTTIPANTQTTSATTATTTLATTVPLQNKTQQALIDANNSIEGTLVVNYGKLYQKAATQCTQSIYDNAYATKRGVAPSGPNSYANATEASPVSVFSKIKALSPSLYNVTYIAQIKDPAIGNLNALQLQINSTSQVVITYEFEGIFQDLTYNEALADYQALNQSSNPCSVYVP